MKPADKPGHFGGYLDPRHTAPLPRAFINYTEEPTLEHLSDLSRQIQLHVDKVVPVSKFNRIRRFLSRLMYPL